MKKSTVTALLKVTVSVLLILSLFKVFPEIKQISGIIKLKNSYIIPAVIMMLLSIFVQSVKWFYLLKTSGCGTSFKDAFLSLSAGLALGFITPGRAGELARGAFIKTGSNSDKILLSFLDRYFLFMITVLFTLISTASAFLFFNIPSAQAVLIIVVSMILLIILLLPFSSDFKNRLMKKAISEHHAGLIPDLSDEKFAVTIALSNIHFLCVFFVFYFIADGVTGVGMGHSLLAFTLMMFVITVLPFTFANIGTRDWSVILGLRTIPAFFFVPSHTVIPSASEAIAVSLVFFFINIVIPAAGGLLVVVFHRIFIK
ncbi:MAG: lysylphosphatidylglycerol synthase transmembrane domain-containing protein [Fibrobacterota bacterium]